MADDEGEPSLTAELKVTERQQSQVELEAELQELEDELGDDDDEESEEELNAFLTGVGVDTEKLDKVDDHEMIGALGNAMVSPNPPRLGLRRGHCNHILATPTSACHWSLTVLLMLCTE